MINRERLYLPVLVLTGVLLFIGLVLIFSSSRVIGKDLNDLFLKQLIWLAIGLAFLILLAGTDFHFWTRNAPFFYLLILLLLAAVLFIGHGRSGTQRWFRLAGFNFQPSEFGKLFFIFTLAAYLEWRKDAVKRFGTLFFAALFILLPPFLLVLLQPNLGTAFIMIPIFLVMFYAAGSPRKHLVTLVLTGCCALPFLWLFLKDYQKQRILVFLNPSADPLGAGYNILQSRIAIGSGGIFGKGFLKGTQTHLAFLPEHHTDFIFSVLAEEWGLLGSTVLLALYLLFLIEIIRIASYTRDRAGTSVAVGIMAMFATQVFINIAMTMGFLPVVGIPLPFLSYGGSSLIASLSAVGILLNIKQQETFI
ncbi:MAG TPA: rod shape-determining protein RodA [bacterium]|nr:rod shape-determining protein RodA [bacterium]HNS48621.1 rod shape-determining protein RodA [bacterium]